MWDRLKVQIWKQDSPLSINACNLIFPLILLLAILTIMIFPWLAGNFTHSARSISLLCLFSTRSQYLLMLQALYTCLIYAPCISPSSSPELIPCEFSEVFLNKTSFLRSTSLGGQHHMWCAHSNCYTSAGQQTVWHKMRNKIQSLQFHSSLTPRAIMCVPLASWPWFLFSLWVIPKLEEQEKLLSCLFLFSWGFFGWKAPDWRSSKTHIFWFWLRPHMSMKVFMYHSSCLDFITYFNRKILWIFIAKKSIWTVLKKSHLLGKKIEVAYINPR